MSQDDFYSQTEDRQTWFLRVDDGSVYGPADTATLKAWCLDGRIEPDNEISIDQEVWVAASSIPELEMDWFACLEDGSRIGPFHIDLVPGLVESGVIPDDALIEHRDTGEKRTAREPDDDAPAAPPPAVPPPEPPDPDEGPALDEPVQPSDTGPSASLPDDEPSTGSGDDMDEEEDGGIPLSKRLEPLQRSASDARRQLVETRQALQQLRAEHTVLKDEFRRIHEELDTARKACREGDRLLLEQQDRATAAETEVENLNAQLEQMKDHYDRLQLENQSQFEQIDRLRAEVIEREQRFKHELSGWQRRSDAKTELLAGAVQTLMQDADLARIMDPGRNATQVAEAESEIERLKTALKQMETRLEHERLEMRRQADANRRDSSVSPAMARIIATLLVLFAGALLLSGIVRWAGSCRRVPVAQRSAGRDHVPPSASPMLPAVESMELQPDTTLPPVSSSASLAPSVPVGARWPAVVLPRAAITQGSRSMKIVFNHGLFSAATRLTPEAEQDLLSLADQLRGRLNGYQLMIEGHTDALPVLAGGSRYVDNFALGMARAEAVKHFLAGAGRLPPDAMRTSSAGDASPPFSNDTETGRMRNRTVILSLVAR